MSNLDRSERVNSYPSIEIEGQTYQLLKVLGIGGLATVYKAIDPNGKIVAIKKYDSLGSRINGIIKKGYETRQQHPSIPKNLLIFPENGNMPHTAVYNYVDGYTAEHDGNTTGRIQERIKKARRLISKVMPILAIMIEEGLVHRDVKPDNIQFSRSGKHATILDPDFLVEEKKLPDSDIYFIGTPYYSSPEQARGEHSPTMDVFSFGVTTAMSYIEEIVPPRLLGFHSNYNPQQILRERALCESTQPPEVQKALLNLDRFPEEIQKDLHGLICFLIGALQPDPTARPSTSEETRQLLESTPHVKSDHGLSSILKQPNTTTFRMPSAKNIGNRIEIPKAA